MGMQRHASTRGVWRLARGASVAAAATGLGAGGHALAGGSASPATVAALATFLAVACVFASRFPWTLSRLALVMLAAQPVFHHWLASDDGAAMHAMEHPQVPWLMPLSHATAALATAVVLWYGERWLRQVLDSLVLRVLAILETGVRLAPSTPALAWHATALPTGREPLSPLRRRGPPK